MILPWAVFLGFVLLMLGLDLGVFHRRAHVVAFKEALLWSGVWVTLGLAFAVAVYFGYEHRLLGLGAAIDPVDGFANDGRTAVEKYLTGYVIEKSLSVDNIFVITMIFGFFGVPALYEHRVLFWGILGALVMRGLMIGVGARLVAEFHWVLYGFAAFLILTAVKMLFLETEEFDPERNVVVRVARRFFPVTSRFHGQHFLVRAGSPAALEAELPDGAPAPDPALEAARPGTLLLTPLALSLIMVEATDLVFAVDSIPAIFAITGDPFLVFTSNVFAILGLRALYGALAGIVRRFVYVKLALAIVLLLVGTKMLLAGWLKSLLGRHFNLYLLGTVLAILAGGVIASMVADRKRARAALGV